MHEHRSVLFDKGVIVDADFRGAAPQGVLRVVDDGERLQGAALRPGNGLAGMQERVAALGGELALRAGAGLALELRVPA